MSREIRVVLRIMSGMGLVKENAYEAQMSLIMGRGGMDIH